MRAVALAMVVVSLAAGSARAATLHCGDVVDRNISLANNLTGCTGDGIDIGADGLTIKLNGHAISAVPPANLQPGQGGIGINFEGHDHVTVIGGPGNSVQSFLTGMLVNGDYNSVQQVSTLKNGSGYSGFLGDAGLTVDGDHNTVLNSTQADGRVDGIDVVGTDNVVAGDNARGNDDNQVTLYGDGNVFTRSRVMGSTDSLGSGITVDGPGAQTVSFNDVASTNLGIYVSELFGTTSPGTTIKANTVRNTRDIGVLLGGTVGPITVVDNQVFKTEVGYDVACCNGQGDRLTGNRAQQDGTGLLVDGLATNITLDHNIAGATIDTSGGTDGDQVGIVVSDSTDTTLIGNHASNNKAGDGIIVIRSSGTTLTGNVANRNAGDGISIDTDGGVISNTHADWNKHYGIEVAGSITNGGANFARNNALGSCVNLVCTS